jgi:hypothetical protein
MRVSVQTQFKLLLRALPVLLAVFAGRPLAFAAAADPIRVVFDLTGSLVQQVPKANFIAGDSRFFQIKHRYYRVADGARETINRLAATPGVEISMFSEIPEDAVKAIVDQLKLSRPITDFRNGKSLAAAFSDPSKAVFVSEDGVGDALGLGSLGVSPRYYDFESFEAAAKAEAELKAKDPKEYENKKAFFPKDEKSWTQHRERMVRAYSILTTAAEGKKPFLAEVKRLAALPPAKKKAKATPNLFAYLTWGTEGEGPERRATCLEKSSNDPKTATPVDADRCIALFPTKLGWHGDRPERCATLTAEGLVAKVSDPSVCLGKAPVAYYWVDPGKTCGAFAPKFTFIAPAEISRCESQVMACSMATGVLTDFTEKLLGPLLAQLVSYANGQEIPKKVIEKADSRSMGRAIVARIHRLKDGKDLKTYYDFYRDTEIQMAFDDARIDQIRASCFLNQHQIESTHGTLDRAWRSRQENAFAQLAIDEGGYQVNFSNPANKVRPKYAYLGITKKHRQVNPMMVSQYGNVFAVMKSAIKDRVTFTPGDSLGMDATRLRTLRHRSATPMAEDGGYWEAQIWGEVCFSDVAYFLVNCSFTTAVSTASIAKLKATGTPVHECKGNNARISAGAAL